LSHHRRDFIFMHKPYVVA